MSCVCEVGVIKASGEGTTLKQIANIDEYDGLSSYSGDAGFRPVFKLKEGIKVVAGNGTATAPYVLSM